MPEQIISASGIQYGLIVDSVGRAQVNASVSAGSESYLYAKSGTGWYPLTAKSGTEMLLKTDASVSVATGSESYIKGGSILTMGQSGGTSYPLLTDTAGILQTSASVTTGSESWIKGGSIITYGIGSVRIAEQGLRLGISGIVDIGNRIAGSIVDMPTINVGAGSVILQDTSGVLLFFEGGMVPGSIISMPSTNVTSTNLDIRDLSVAQDSVVSHLGSTSIYNLVAGSIVNIPNIDINNPTTIGSWTGYTGSIWTMPPVTATDLDIRDLAAATDSITTGSNVWIQNPVGISGVNDIGSVVIKSAPLLGISGAIFTGGDIVGSVNIATNLSLIGSFTGMGPKVPLTYTGSLIVSGGTADSFIGSHVVSLNNEINWISIIGSAGSTYNFELRDSEGYSILSNLSRSGRMSYMTPFLASGNIAFIISGAQVSGNYPLRLGYT